MRAWRNLSARVLFRDQWTCQRCGARADHVDHITPLLFGGTNDESNLESLCQDCNLTEGGR
jgi:5-methylcytosine-specific restriction protein A